VVKVAAAFGRRYIPPDCVVFRANGPQLTWVPNVAQGFRPARARL